MKNSLTIREVRSIVRSTLREMKLGLASYRMDSPIPDEKTPLLQRTTPPVQFAPDQEAKEDDVWRRNWSAKDVTDPMLNFRYFIDDTDDEYENVEDFEIADDLDKL